MNILRIMTPVVVALTTLAAPARLPAAEPATRTWQFTALLDDEPIGEHRFVVTPSADEGGPPGEPRRRAVSSQARFDVRFLGFTAYRYRHEARESWRGDCLHSITAITDDDGKRSGVRGRATDGGFAIDGGPVVDGGPDQRQTGCLMTFAYWNPALASQRRLLDPGSGRIESVTIEAIPVDAARPIPVRGVATPVRGLRIRGLPQPIEVWYAGDDWVGLDTTVAGSRRLSYRLR